MTATRLRVVAVIGKPQYAAAMRGKALVFAVVLAVLVAGCGSGSSPPAGLTPQDLPQIRSELKQSLDAHLRKLGRPAKEIACVNRNIEAMGVRQVAERIIEPSVVPPSKETAAQAEGPLGRGCP
jgi:hypothetical protein